MKCREQAPDSVFGISIVPYPSNPCPVQSLKPKQDIRVPTNHPHMLFSGHLWLPSAAILKFYHLIQLLRSRVPFTSSRSSCWNPGTEVFHFESRVILCNAAPPGRLEAELEMVTACLAGEVPHRSSKWCKLSWLHRQDPLWAGVPSPRPPVRQELLPLLPTPSALPPSFISPTLFPGFIDLDSCFPFILLRLLVAVTA